MPTAFSAPHWFLILCLLPDSSAASGTVDSSLLPERIALLDFCVAHFPSFPPYSLASLFPPPARLWLLPSTAPWDVVLLGVSLQPCMGLSLTVYIPNGATN